MVILLGLHAALIIQIKSILSGAPLGGRALFEESKRYFQRFVGILVLYAVISTLVFMLVSCVGSIIVGVISSIAVTGEGTGVPIRPLIGVMTLVLTLGSLFLRLVYAATVVDDLQGESATIGYVWDWVRKRFKQVVVFVLALLLIDAVVRWVCFFSHSVFDGLSILWIPVWQGITLPDGWHLAALLISYALGVIATIPLTVF